MSEPSAEACAHRRIDVLVAIQADGMPGMWACHDCKLRFYPACQTCVDVGHRNVVHPADAARESAGAGLDVERLARAYDNVTAKLDSERRVLSERVYGHPGAHIAGVTFTWAAVAAEYARLAAARLPAAQPERRPTTAELMAMPAEEFAAFASRAGLVPPSDEEPPA